MYALKFFMCTISPFGYGQEEIVMANKLWLSMTWVRQLNLVMVRPGLEIRIMIMDKQLVNELQVCDSLMELLHAHPPSQHPHPVFPP